MQPTQIALGTVQNATDKLKLNFTYNTSGQNDNNGNVLSQTITVPTVGATAGFTAVQTYSYDALNRLKSATENIDGNPTPEWKQTFLYDRYGNRNFDTNGTNTTTIPSGCAAAVCNPQVDPATNKLVGYQLDNAGNTKVDANGRQFIYDGENKQVEVKDQSGNTIGKYFYDGDGKRVKKVVGLETTIFIYDASGRLVAEYASTVEPASSAKVSYLTSDHLGSPRITTDKDGTVISRRDFMPFGEEISTNQRTVGLGYAGDTVRQKFTSYERDNETELNFAQARYQNDSLGRFTSPDPLMASVRKTNPQTFNRYVYVLNNPMKFTNPTGLIEMAGCANGGKYCHQDIQNFSKNWEEKDRFHNYIYSGEQGGSRAPGPTFPFGSPASLLPGDITADVKINVPQAETFQEQDENGDYIQRSQITPTFSLINQPDGKRIGGYEYRRYDLSGVTPFPVDEEFVTTEDGEITLESIPVNLNNTQLPSGDPNNGNADEGFKYRIDVRKYGEKTTVIYYIFVNSNGVGYSPEGSTRPKQVIIPGRPKLMSN